jgi:hypothetical protein
MTNYHFKEFMNPGRMKANELRIGNLCQDKISGAQLKVTGTHKNDISFYVIDRNLFPLQPGWQAEPIPLTEEWLVKFGLMSTELGFWNNGDAIYFDYGKENEKSIELKYVHQLQNLYFALTGEELEMK